MVLFAVGFLAAAFLAAAFFAAVFLAVASSSASASRAPWRARHWPHLPPSFALATDSSSAAQADHLPGRRLLADDGLGLAVLGFRLDDLDQGVAVVVDELDAHRLQQRERALEIGSGTACRR
ncbi:hypothetical protein [Streptomyces sp. NPDC096030]|uniref:hypothetical protein n=1 Tax=Streptomyces sp. NPDC096030 TaxID=3155423 RepID=UPI0033313F7E